MKLAMLILLAMTRRGDARVELARTAVAWTLSGLVPLQLLLLRASVHFVSFNIDPTAVALVIFHDGQLSCAALAPLLPCTELTTIGDHQAAAQTQQLRPGRLHLVPMGQSAEENVCALNVTTWISQDGGAELGNDFRYIMAPRALALGLHKLLYLDTDVFAVSQLAPLLAASDVAPLVVANSNADRYHRWVKREFLGGRAAEVRAAAAARSRLCGGSPMLARSPSTQE